MPPANHDRREDVLDTARRGGWSVSSERTDHGAMSDRSNLQQSHRVGQVPHLGTRDIDLSVGVEALVVLTAQRGERTEWLAV